MSIRHWGEMPSVDLNIKSTISADIEKAMDQFCLSEFDSSGECESNVDPPIILTPQDPLVMYAISLHKHMTNMTEIIRLSELAIESNVRPSVDAAPPVPPLPKVEFKHQFNCLNFIPKKETDFTCGKDLEIPVLDEAIVTKLLRKSICTLFAHLGFETSHESVINVLIDVLREFFKLVCSRLESAIHDEKVNGSCGFPHVIERILVEMGIGGVRGLHDYYNSRVINYVNVLRERCHKLNGRYNQLLEEKGQSPELDFGKMMGMEMKKEEIEENPEVHLLDGEIELSSLETGFQLLNSLEEANLQNLIEGEELVTTESPGNPPSDVEYVPVTKKFKNKKE